MAVSVDALRHWIVSNHLAEEGSQRVQDLTVSLMAVIRDKGSEVRDTRNVHEFLKTLTSDEIRENLQQTRSDLISVFVNVLGDFNVGTAIRNANWFNTRSVWIIGNRRWDRRGAVGTHHYTDVQHRDSVVDAIAELRNMGYRIVAAEITDDATALWDYEWTEKSAVIYGEEGAGLSAEVLALVDDVVYIPGRGSVRSLNVGTASGIFMSDYTAKVVGE